MDVCAVCEFWLRPRTFGCIAMGSALLFCFVQAKTLCSYGCMYFLAALVLVCVWMLV